MRELEIVGTHELDTEDKINKLRKDPEVFEFYSACCDMTLYLREKVEK